MPHTPRVPLTPKIAHTTSILLWQDAVYLADLARSLHVPARTSSRSRQCGRILALPLSTETPCDIPGNRVGIKKGEFCRQESCTTCDLPIPASRLVLG